jgi:hypothetical protein
MRTGRDLSDPRNLIYAAKKALGLEVTEEKRQHYDGSEYTVYGASEKYPANLERRGRLSDGRRVKLTKSLSVTRGARMQRGRWVRSSAHRIFIECPECRQWIPIGRYSQHQGKRSCHIEKVSYASRTAPKRSRVELRRLAYRASRSSAAREVLHDALLEAFPSQYPDVLRRAQSKANKRVDPGNFGSAKTDVYVIFKSSLLGDYRRHSEREFFDISRMNPAISKYLGPGTVVSFVARPQTRRRS